MAPQISRQKGLLGLPLGRGHPALLWTVFGLERGNHFEYAYVLFLPLIWIAMRGGLMATTWGIVATQFGLILAVQATGLDAAAAPARAAGAPARTAFHR